VVSERQAEARGGGVPEEGEGGTGGSEKAKSDGGRNLRANLVDGSHTPVQVHHPSLFNLTLFSLSEKAWKSPNYLNFV
jgi:hypothetical protein